MIAQFETLKHINVLVILCGFVLTNTACSDAALDEGISAGDKSYYYQDDSYDAQGQTFAWLPLGVGHAYSTQEK